MGTEVSLPAATMAKKDDQKVSSNENGHMEAVRDCGSEEASSTVTPTPSQTIEEDNVTPKENGITELGRESVNEVSLETPNPSPTASQTQKEDKNVTFIKKKEVELDENPKVSAEVPKPLATASPTQKEDVNTTSNENEKESTREQELSKEIE